MWFNGNSKLLIFGEMNINREKSPLRMLLLSIRKWSMRFVYVMRYWAVLPCCPASVFSREFWYFPINSRNSSLSITPLIVPWDCKLFNYAATLLSIWILSVLINVLKCSIFKARDTRTCSLLALLTFLADKNPPKDPAANNPLSTITVVNPQFDMNVPTAFKYDISMWKGPRWMNRRL